MRDDSDLLVPRTEASGVRAAQMNFQKDSHPQAGNYGWTDSKVEPLLGPNPEPIAAANRVTAGKVPALDLLPIQRFAVGAVGAAVSRRGRTRGRAETEQIMRCVNCETEDAPQYFVCTVEDDAFCPDCYKNTACYNGVHYGRCPRIVRQRRAKVEA